MVARKPKTPTLEERAEELARITRRESVLSAVLFKKMALSQLRAAVLAERKACAEIVSEVSVSNSVALSALQKAFDGIMRRDKL